MDIDDLTTQSTLPAYIELFDIDVIATSLLQNVGFEVAASGTFHCTPNINLTVGSKVIIAGILSGTGSIPSLAETSTYYITSLSTVNGQILFDLSTTVNGSPIVCTAGTLTGLRFTVVTNTIYRFTPNVNPNNTPIMFGGDTYTPFPIEITSYSQTSDEAPARPTLSVSNINKLFGILSFTLQDIIGAKVIYYRTFETYLNQPTKVSAAPLKFTIARKTAHNMSVISFELRSPLDADRAMLPKRQMLKRDFPGLGINKVL
jgi:hypothetical protein